VDSDRNDGLRALAPLLADRLRIPIACISGRRAFVRTAVVSVADRNAHLEGMSPPSRTSLRWPAVLAAGLLLATSAAHAQPSLVVRPYLQSVDTDTAIIGLRLDRECPVTVHFGSEGGALEQAATSPNGVHHFVTLEGMKAGQRYAYRVEACGQDTLAGGSFQAAPPPTERQVTFGVNGDFGTGGARQKEVAAVMTQRMPDFWLGVGDIAYTDGTDEEFVSKLFAPMSGLLANSPFFPVLGNHEYKTQDAQPYLNNLELPRDNPAATERYYAFDWGPVHVVGLDSQCAAGHASTCTLAEQRAFLEQSLGSSTAPWKIVMLHHPPYSSGSHGSNSKVQGFIPTLEAGGVDLVLTGHDHNYERSHPLKGGQVVPEGTPGAVRYLVVGAGGATLRQFPGSAPAWSAYRNNTDYGYLEVEIDGGTLQGRFINTQGQVVDQFTLTKDVPDAPAPQLSVSAEPAEGPAPLTVTLTAQGAPNPDDVVWNLGDGELASGAVVTHTYAAPGQYTATASVPGAGGGVQHSVEVAVQDEVGQVGPVVEPPPFDPPQGPGEGDEVGEGDEPGEGDGLPGVGCSAGAGGLFVGPLALATLLFRRRRRAIPGSR
jgi:hypothetical protein